MRYTIYKLPYEREPGRHVWYVEEERERTSGVFGTEGEAALWIYKRLLADATNK